MAAPSPLRRWLVIAGLGLLSLLLALTLAYRTELMRVYQVITLFDEQNIVENFRSMGTVFDTRTVANGSLPHRFPVNLRSLPETYMYDGEIRRLTDFLEDTWTTGLVIVHEGEIVYEAYFLGNEQNSQVISWSLAKSVVSALVGVAVEEGFIRDINQPVTDYVPKLAGTGYDGVTIKNVLQMSSGIGFDENYADFFSDINRMGRTVALGTSLDRFVASLPPERPQGTYNHYVSMDTQVLGMVLREATGENLAAFTESRLWQPLGMAADAYWLIDRAGMEAAFGGLNAQLRDYARFGWLYLNEGRWGDEQVVPAHWVRASVTPDGPHLQPGDNPLSNTVLGYGYQWWIPANPDGDFLGMGIAGQYLYVNPRYRLVIAKSSAYAHYRKDGFDKDLESIEVFRTITRHLSEPESLW